MSELPRGVFLSVRLAEVAPGKMEMEIDGGGRCITQLEKDFAEALSLELHAIVPGIAAKLQCELPHGELSMIAKKVGGS